MKKLIIAIIAIAVVAAGAMLVVAQKAGHRGGDHFRGRGHGMMGGMALRGLDLTDEQKAQVKEIMTASHERTASLREAARAGRTQLQELTANGAFDEAEVTALATQQANTAAQLTVERLRVKSQVYALLTDEQKAKAAEMKAKFGERMKDRGWKRGGEKKDAGDQ